MQYSCFCKFRQHCKKTVLKSRRLRQKRGENFVRNAGRNLAKLFPTSTRTLRRGRASPSPTKGPDHGMLRFYKRISAGSAADDGGGFINLFFDRCQHPSGVPSAIKGTLLTKAFAFAGTPSWSTGMFSFSAFRVPLSTPEKKRNPYGCLFFSGVDNGTRTHDLQSHNLTP